MVDFRYVVEYLWSSAQGLGFLLLEYRGNQVLHLYGVDVGVKNTRKAFIGSGQRPI